MTRRIAATATALAVILPMAAGTGATADETPQGLDSFPDPVDPESWELPEWMTWDDYRPIPNVDWNDPDRQPAKKLRAALILGDFQDREFVITEPTGSDAIGGIGGMGFNPQALPGGEDARPTRETVGDWYADFLIREPSELNNFHTVNEYWLEDSYGKIGVDAESFGPYRMDGKEHEYGLGGTDAGGGGDQCPKGDTCGEGGVLLVGKFDRELLEKSTADVTAAQAVNGEDYDFRYLLHAGYDESGVWQEFGEMLFPTKEDVTDELGHPHNHPHDPGYTPDEQEQNWAETRYIEWTSFAAAEGIWSHALPGLLSTQGENDGHSTFAHELSHIFGVLDNYNNPFNSNRSYTGTWAQLSRGTFNGPGGTHNRWQIPPTLGGTMGSHHMLRNKIRLGFTPPHEVLTLSKASLEQTGPQFATIYPRAYPLAPVTEDVGLHGVVVHLGRDEGKRPQWNGQDPDQNDRGNYTNYTIEFVDRIGFDSFTTDSGVLLAKNKDGVDLAPFMWAIDAHPEDINDRTGVGEHEGREIFDFIEPGTTDVKRKIALGDARQLADALFHAGTGEGVVSEHVDEGNRLHFYVLDTDTDERGVSTYRVAVRHLDGSGPFTRSLEMGDATVTPADPGRVATATFPVTNTGTGTDLVRLSVDGGLAYHLTHEVIEVPAGETVDVPVYVAMPAEADDDEAFEVTLTATSENGGAEASSTTGVTPADDDGDDDGNGDDLSVTAAGSDVTAAGALPATGGGLVLAGMSLAGLALALRRPTREGAR